MNAEQYLKRIENTKISTGDNYTRKELIDFAEKYAKQLRLCGVNYSLRARNTPVASVAFRNCCGN